MTLLGTGFRRILILLIIAVCIILVALNIILNIKLRSEIPGLIEKFSNDSPYKINVEKISLDPLFRVRFDKVSVVDPKVEIKNVLEIDKVTIRPRILSSIFSQTINLGEIVLNKPRAESNKENLNNLINFIDTLKQDSKEGRSVDVSSVRILYADFRINPDFVISVPALELLLERDDLKEGLSIDFSGRVALLGNEFKPAGSVAISSSKIYGDVNIHVDDISAKSFKFLFGSEELRAQTQLTFEVTDLVSLNGKLNIFSHDGTFEEKSFADMSYELNYDKQNDLADVNKLEIKMNDLLSGAFSGEITDVISETNFNLSGQLSPIDLNNLIIKMSGDDNGILSGELSTKNIKVSGSREKSDIRLSGESDLDGFIYKSDGEDGSSVENLNCELKFNQSLSNSNYYNLSSNGNCEAEKFAWDKTGDVNKIKSRVNLSSANSWSDNKITLSGISSQYMDGSAGGTLKFFLDEGFAGGITRITGDITGSNLNLEKTPKTIIPANIAGNAVSASASFEGGSSNYKADINLAADNFILKSTKGREFRVSNIKTSSPVDFEYKSVNDEATSSEASRQDDIIIKGQGISYQNLSFEEYKINKGNIIDVDFLLELGNDKWSLNMSSEGNDFTIAAHDISLEKFSESLQIENSGREGFQGTIQGTNGKYNSIDFPDLSWDYNFINDRIIVSNVVAQISTMGQFEADNLFINVGDGVGGYPYNIDFSDATFIGFDDKLNSQGINGDFIINKPGETKYGWQGSVNIRTTSLASAIIEDITNTITPREGGINLENIEAKFLNGRISGDINIDTRTSPSGVVTNLKLVDASTSSGATNIKISQANLGFAGTLPSSSLPEGDGKLELKNITLDNHGAFSTLDAEINTRTVSETLYIDEGFIKDNSSKKIKFSGDMQNSLNENRTLTLKFPEVSMSDAMGIFSPLVPPDFRDFKTRGYAGMDLIFHKLFYPDSKWAGKLTLKNSFLSGEYGGALLSINGINGIIRIKDNASSENPISEVMDGNLKLSKSIFQKFLKSFKDTNLEKEDLDFLSIAEIEYGILNFENVECALEVDTQKINLRRILSKLFRGSLDGAGLIQFSGGKTDYNISLLFNEMSLESISQKVSPNQQYITGRINGLLWFAGQGTNLNTINGPFKFWSKKSGKEPRRIGQALLNQLGARERLILGSSRAYDKGNISGYISNGLITFREFSVSNSILGIKNLSIQADPVKNSITIEHLISVIRELSRRSAGAGPTIETN